MRSGLLIMAMVALVATACDSAKPAGQSQAAAPAAPAPAAASGYKPNIDPSNFVDKIDNPLFRLEPGTTFRLRGQTEDGVEDETVTVTDRSKEVMGVTTTVVKDVVEVDGEVVESTFDWYAQDRDGNVWYFGEDTAEIENGKVVSREGSWEAGVDGAQPGIIMNADPQVTDSYRQEYYEGEAEDMYWVVETDASEKTSLGKFDHVVRTIEWTPLEPKLVVEKTYAPKVGLLSERALSGPTENVELLEVVHR
jgi:hypothetical protein